MGTLINFLKQKLRLPAWNPYFVGVVIGLLSWVTFLTVGKLIGITTAFEYSAAMIGQGIAPAMSASHDYFQSRDKNPRIDWEWMLVVGVFMGALISSRISGDRAKATVPQLWRERFGPSVAKRMMGAFFGGAIMMFGARLAQGCTSGHGISGLLQLAISSQVFVATFFVAGVGSAYLIFGREVARRVYGPFSGRGSSHG